MGRLRAMLFTQQAVVEEAYREDGASLLQIRLPKSDLLRILSAASLSYEDLMWDGQALSEPDDWAAEL